MKENKDGGNISDESNRARIINFFFIMVAALPACAEESEVMWEICETTWWSWAPGFLLGAAVDILDKDRSNNIKNEGFAVEIVIGFGYSIFKAVRGTRG